MTCSNGSYNSNSLANPFNTRLGPSNYTLNPHGQGRQLAQHGINRARTDLPDPKPAIFQDDLHVPQREPAQATTGDFIRAAQALYDNGSMDWRAQGPEAKMRAASQPSAQLSSASKPLSPEQKQLLSGMESQFPGINSLEQ